MEWWWIVVGTEEENPRIKSLLVARALNQQERLAFETAIDIATR
jgi:hypothetical protein